MKTHAEATPRKRSTLTKNLLVGSLSIFLHLGLLLVLVHVVTTRTLFEEPNRIPVQRLEPKPDVVIPKVPTILVPEDILDKVVEELEMGATVEDAQPEAAPVEETDATLETHGALESVLQATFLVDKVSSNANALRNAGSSFGFGNQVQGDLTASMYDLKRDASGKPRNAEYLRDLQGVLKGNLSPSAFKPFYKVPRALYMTHLFVPKSDADEGPKAFGVGDLMEGKNWIVHYNGHIQTPLAGEYRFVGMFDDLLMVLIDGKVVHEFLWTGDPTPWEPAEYIGTHDCFAGKPLVYGDWFRLGSLETKKLDILVGEHPGGLVGGVLMIQRKGQAYETGSQGRPILPVFAVQPLSDAEQQALQRATYWPLASQTPVMGAHYDPGEHTASQAATEDIQIQLDIQ